MSLIGVIGSAARRRDSGPWTPESVTSAGIVFWLEPDTLTGSTWADKSAEGNDWTLDSGQEPYVEAGDSEWLSDDVVRFDTGDLMSGPSLSALTAGEMFILFRKDYIPGGAFGSWTFGTNTDSGHVVWADGNWYEGFGRSTRPTIGVVGHAAVADPIIADLISTSSEWTVLLDGSSQYTTGTNTVSFPSAPKVGTDRGFHFLGEIRAMIFYDGKLSAGDRSAVYDYLDAMRA
jgi:hypothetical protein